jgi:hypothetical protein
MVQTPLGNCSINTHDTWSPFQDLSRTFPSAEVSAVIQGSSATATKAQRCWELSVCGGVVRSARHSASRRSALGRCLRCSQPPRRGLTKYMYYYSFLKDSPDPRQSRFSEGMALKDIGRPMTISIGVVQHSFGSHHGTSAGNIRAGRILLDTRQHHGQAVTARKQYRLSGAPDATLAPGPMGVAVRTVRGPRKC